MAISRILSATLLAAFLLVTRPSLAQRVLLVEPSASDTTLLEAFNRLRAELMLQEFEVTVIAPGEALSPEMLEAEAQRAGAFAGILLTRASGGATADVCIADRVTGKISQRRLAIPDERQAPRVLAVRAVDLLRSSLRELESGERPPPDVVGVAPEAVAPRVREFSNPPKRFRLQAAFTAAGLGSELGSAFGGSIGVYYRPTPWLSTGLFAAGPLVGAEYETTGGTAVIRQELVLASLAVNALPPGAFELGPAIGAGAYHLRAYGEVEPPLRSQSDELVSFAASGGVECGLHLGPSVVVSASLAALLLSPRPVVAVETAQTRLGAPLVMASLGMGVAF